MRRHFPIRNREAARRDFLFRLAVWYSQIITLTRFLPSTIIGASVSTLPLVVGAFLCNRVECRRR
jgi:hypothetical protein